LEREAAVVVALGGGFQAYFKQKRDGSVFDEHVPIMAQVARFCRARQAVCHRAEAVPQIALLFSTPAHYRRASGLFSRELSRLHGTLQALLESQQSVEVLGEHHLTGRLAEYPLVIVPEWEYLDTAFQEELKGYVRGGGNLLLIGPRTAAMFEKELAVRFAGESKPEAAIAVDHAGRTFETKGQSQSVELIPPAAAFGQLRVGRATDGPAQPAASISALGKGRIAAIYFTFGQGYLRTRNADSRAFLNLLVRQLFPEPLVEVTGSPDVDVSVHRSHGLLTVNLVNTSGPHATEPIVESIAPVGPLTVRIRTPQAPTSLVLEPGGEQLTFTHREGIAQVTIPSLEIHRALVVK
jgi:hypothetical protein